VSAGAVTVRHVVRGSGSPRAIHERAMDCVAWGRSVEAARGEAGAGPAQPADFAWSGRRWCRSRSHIWLPALAVRWVGCA